MADADKRAIIMRAAEELFATRRFHEITTDDIAQLAHVGKGTIYRHFADKDDLFLQTVMNGFDDLCEAISASIAGQSGCRQQLLEACRQVSDFFVRRHQVLRMMHSAESCAMGGHGSLGEKYQVNRRKVVDTLAEIIARGVSQGLVRTDITPAVLASFLLGMLRTRARDLTDLADDKRPIEMVVDIFCHGAGRAGNQAKE